METWWGVAFSGFGVALIGWIGILVYRHFKKEKDTSTQNIIGSTITGAVAGRDINIEQLHIPAQSSTPSAEEEYHERPTPKEMLAEINKVSMYAQQSVAQTFTGLKVRWRGTLGRIRLTTGTKTEVAMDVEGSFVFGYVDINDYPILKTVRGGEPVTVNGTIDDVQTNGIVQLKLVKLKFHRAIT